MSMLNQLLELSDVQKKSGQCILHIYMSEDGKPNNNHFGQNNTIEDKIEVNSC